MTAADMPFIQAANEAGLFAKALVVTSRLAAQSPLDRDIVMLHARQLAYLKHFRAAADAILHLFSRKTADAQSLELLAQVLAAGGDYREACNVLAQLLRVDFERDEMHALWTHCVAEGYSDKEGAEALSQLAAGDPQHCAAIYQLAILRDRQGSLEEASGLAERCAVLLPNSSLVEGLRARLALLRGDIDDAVRHQQAVYDRMAALVEAREKPRVALAPAPESLEQCTPTLYIPVEISSRELMSRLLVAIFAARAGFTVVMMGHTVLRKAVNLPRGFVLNKSLHVMDDIIVAEARRRGHKLCVIDEEAFGWTGGINSLLRTLDPGLLPACAALFAPGKYYVDEIGAIAPTATLVASGNPRTDFFNPQLIGLITEEAEKVREAQGRSILICTNFGGWNSRIHSFATMCLVSFRVPGIPMSSDRGRWLQDIYKDSSGSECYDTAMVRQAIPALAEAFPGHKIIVRPHPVEDAKVWERLLARTENVVVSGAESLHVQMFASDVMVHVEGCGTGLEARLAGRPTVCLHAGKQFAYPKLGISGKLSPSAHDIPQLLRQVADAINAPAPALTPEQNELIARHIERPPKLVSALIADYLTDMFVASTGRDPRDAGVDSAAPEVLRDLLSVAQVKAEAAAFGNIGLRAKRFSAGKEKLEGHIKTLTSRLGITGSFIVDMLAEGVVMMRPGT